MMINGLSSSSINANMMTGQRQRPNYVMTDEQKTQVSELITKYDSSNMNPDSMKSLMEEIKALGVKPGEDLKNIMDSAGFKPPQAPKEGMGRPQKSRSGLNELPDFLKDFIQKSREGSVTDDDVNTLVAELQNNGYGTSGSIIDEEV